MDSTEGKREPESSAAQKEHEEVKNLRWWQRATVYQVLVPSFKDTNDDGRGDLQGVLENLDYFVDLGVDIVWLSPIFESPMFDMGYDISDYKNVNPLYGTLDDVYRLVKKSHEKGLKLILDIALNHTSQEHEWFQTSRVSRRDPNGPKRDWYIWRPPKYDAEGNKQPPNNWESAFGGSAWTWDEEAQEYCKLNITGQAHRSSELTREDLHLFGDKQPDLNWENPELRQELYEVLRWWLDKGIDGFRLDCMNLISKTPGLPDAQVTKPDSPFQPANCLFANGPNVHTYLQEMYEHVFSKYDVVTIGEMSCGITPAQAIEYVSLNKPRPELNLIIQFQHVELDCYDGDKWLLREWELPELKKIITEWQHTMIHHRGWNTLWTENHDQPRGVSRFTTSNPRFRALCAKLLATWLFTLQGTPFVYQGQELGMINPGCFSEEMNKDIETVMFWNSAAEAAKDGNPQKAENAKRAILQKGRDNTRVPIPWSDGPHGGFTTPTAKPWIPPCPDGDEWCLKNQQKASDSVLSFYHDIIRLRKFHPTLLYGTYECLDPDNPRTWSYIRRSKHACYLVILNFSADAASCSYTQEGLTLHGARLLICNYNTKTESTEDPLVLRPYEGRLYKLKIFESE